MAVNRVLTNAEKEQLQSSTRFKSEADWAIRNFASYWSSTDQGQIGTQIGQVGYENWFKNHIFATDKMQSGINDPDISLTFLVLAKGMNLWDSAVIPFNIDTVIDYMIANSKFDELATGYASLKTQSILF